MRAIFVREIKGYFNTFSGYIFIALYLLSSGILFAVFNLSEGSAKVTSLLSGMQYVLLVIIPIITIRLFGENKELKMPEKLFPKKSKFIDRTLLSAPVSSGQIAAGKFLSAFSMLLAVLIITLIYPLILAALGSFSWAEDFAALSGLLFYGTMLISICVFISSAVRGRVPALAVTLAAMLFIYLSEAIIPEIQNTWLSAVLIKLTPTYHLNYFVSGVISLFSIIYFVSITLLFLFFTGKSIEHKRWS